MATALITGASSGIGMELAGVFAREGFDLFLVARDGERLAKVCDALKVAYGIQAHYLEQDLSVVGAPEALVEALDAQGMVIDALVNNAGVGIYGKLIENDTERLRAMLRINILVPTFLCRLLGARMAERGGGRILNVASAAAFMPGPWMAGYYASKAYLLSFSEALASELQGTGVTVTALCPGPIATAFMDVSGMAASKLVAGKKLPASQAVAEYGYRAMRRGKRVAVYGFRNKLYVFLMRLLPRGLVARLVRRAQEPLRPADPLAAIKRS